MGSKHSRPQPLGDGKARPDESRPRDNQHGDEISAEARAEFSVDDIHSLENTRRAQQLWSSDNDRFCKYRNYFKNHHMSLAREVGRKASKSKAELLRWVEDAVGPLERGVDCTKDEILEIAMVSAALTEYGETALARMYDRGELDALPNVPLHTHNLRMPAKQQACRDNSDAANKDKLEAAHYIGLEVMLRLNERLPVEQRMGEELREILNHPSNLRLMLATSNQVLHKKVDAMLIKAKDAPPPSEQTQTSNKQSRKISAREYDRLVQIAKHAQDEGFQDAMIAANGHYLYASLRRQFTRLGVGNRPKLWDIEKDKSELQQVPRGRFRSPSPAPHPPRTPPSPQKKADPKTRMAQHSPSTNSMPEQKHRNPFSRLAAKIFHSHSKKKKNHATRSTSTTTMASSQEPPRPVKVKAPVRGTSNKQDTKVKKNAGNRVVTAPRKDKRNLAKRKQTLPRTGAKTPARQKSDFSADSSEGIYQNFPHNHGQFSKLPSQ
ncbi:hypothetical protein PR003_g27692 [Phytophthora rubi]|uniref:Uncharacterized protein n=2 Tax=Phytophthora rubi TaxID=129364 RepID=A0A6A3HT60_9STRA|nr:hypothetical protein PR001_g26561 [Phytophthora rubi]KAE9281367.1 hypothetical protein PR003_g27692 [Phytophthora rubi]